MAKTRGNRTVAVTMLVSLIVLVSKAGGFIREIIMAKVYGTSMQMDAYNAAYGLYYIPVLLFSSCITSTLVPLYIQTRADKGIKRANRFASNVMTIFAILAVALSLVLVLLTPLLVKWVYPGFGVEQAAITVRMTRIMLPALVFFVTAIVLSSVLNANESFCAAQLTGFPLSVALIVAALLFSNTLGVEALAYGIFAAGVMQVLLVLPFAARVFRYKPRINFRDPVFRTLMRLAIPAILSMAVNELNHLIDRSLASGLPEGSISAMNFAYKLITFVLGVLIVPLTTVMFSKMSALEAQNNHKGVLRTVMQCFEVVVAITLPIVLIAGVLASDVIRLAYMRGQFDERSVTLTSGAFLFYLVGLTFFSLRDLLNRAFHSLKDTKTPMLVAIASVLANVIMNVILVRFMGVRGLALATSLSGLMGCAALLVLLRRKAGKLRFRRTSEELIKMGIAGALCAVVCIVLNRVLPASLFASATLSLLVRIAFIALCSAAVYVGVALLLGARQIRSGARMALRLVHRG